MLREIVVCLLPFFVSTAAISAPIAFDELTGGDIDNQLFNLDIGSNTISGIWTLEYLSTVDYDNFLFSVPTHAVVTDISMSFDDSDVTVTDDGWAFSVSYGMGDLAFNLISRSDILFFRTVSPVHFPLGDMPLTGETYRMGQTSGFRFLEGVGFPVAGDGGSVPYTWTFNLEPLPPVPIPASVWLFITAILGFFGFSKKKLLPLK